MSPSYPYRYQVLNSIIDHNELWAEQFPHIELHQKWKEANGKYSGKGWTRRTESSLIKYSLIRDCTILPVVMLADLY